MKQINLQPVIDSIEFKLVAGQYGNVFNAGERRYKVLAPNYHVVLHWQGHLKKLAQLLCHDIKLKTREKGF